jgi:putative flippase GtrA
VAVVLDLARQYLRFGLVGGVATLTHVLIFAAAIELFACPPLLANVIGFVVAVGVSFFGHYRWTFSWPAEAAYALPLPRLALARFAAVALLGLVLNSAVVGLVTGLLGLDYVYAIPPMILVVPVVLFLLGKFWAFRGELRNVSPSHARDLRQ